MVLLTLKIREDYRIINLDNVSSIDYVEETGELRIHELTGDMTMYLVKGTPKAKVWDKIFMALSHAYETRGGAVAAVQCRLDVSEFLPVEEKF